MTTGQTHFSGYAVLSFFLFFLLLRRKVMIFVCLFLLNIYVCIFINSHYSNTPKWNPAKASSRQATGKFKAGSDLNNLLSFYCLYECYVICPLKMQRYLHKPQTDRMTWWHLSSAGTEKLKVLMGRCMELIFVSTCHLPYSSFGRKPVGNGLSLSAGQISQPCKIHVQITLFFIPLFLPPQQYNLLINRVEKKQIL